MTGSQLVIRAVQPGEAESGADCPIACWREAYADIVDPERLALLTAPVAGRVELLRRWIGDRKPIIVAADSGDIVGFAVAGFAAEPNIDIDFQLYAINVVRRTGVAASPSAFTTDPLAIRQRFFGCFATTYEPVPSTYVTATAPMAWRS